MHFLKNYFLISLFTISLFTSCSEEDNNETTPNEVVSITEADLVGEWELTGFKVDNGKSTTSVAGQEFTSEFTQQGSNFDYSAVITRNPNIMTGEGSYTLTTNTTITVLGEPQTNTQSVDINSDNLDSNLLSGEWELIEGGTVLQSTNKELDITTTAKILSYTATEFVYSIDLSQGQVLENSPAEISVTGNAIVTLTR